VRCEKYDNSTDTTKGAKTEQRSALYQDKEGSFGEKDGGQISGKGGPAKRLDSPVEDERGRSRRAGRKSNAKEETYALK